MMLDDATLSHVPRALIRSLRCNAEWALTQQMDYLVAQFDKIDDPYLRERKADVVQVVERVLKAMHGAAGTRRLRAAARGAPDRGGARPVAGGHDPVQAASVSPASSPTSAA